ncbi:MAG: TIGR02301 family protein [Rhizobiales bacterium]|nr:TIGR02301 family protein [Hyphomicrobiales bacterium]MBN9009177.1 TIGR02301 family protein [Hyphomicrobiales bacterium]
MLAAVAGGANAAPSPARPIPQKPLSEVTVAPGKGLTPADKPSPAQPPVPGLPPGAPAYDEQLLRLSEILGAMHYLRPLCGSDEGALWRNEMEALLTAEQPDATRKARFVDRFNHGYEGFRSVYRVCTPAATLAIGRYMAEGARIARDVSARYGKER